MQEVQNGEWNFTSAQTNVELKDEAGASLVSAGQRMIVTWAEVVCSYSNSNNFQARLGFAATTLAAKVANSANCRRGIIISHPGMARGGGKTNPNGGATLVVGGIGLKPFFTCSDPGSSGEAVVLLSWIIEPADS